MKRGHHNGCIKRGDGLRCTCGADDFNAGFEAGRKAERERLLSASVQEVDALTEMLLDSLAHDCNRQARHQLEDALEELGVLRALSRSSPSGGERGKG